MKKSGANKSWRKCFNVIYFFFESRKFQNSLFLFPSLTLLQISVDYVFKILGVSLLAGDDYFFQRSFTNACYVVICGV